jgi:glycosyltransferase involved in cell wall biosynthesis
VTDVSVVICAYTTERWDDLVAAVKSVRAQDFQPREVLVVIDHSPDLEARARAELDGVTVVASTHAKGLSGARNAGVAAATAPVVAFLDDDATADPSWLSRLVAPFEDPAVIGVGGYADAEFPSGRPAWFPPEFDWVVGCTYVGHAAAGDIRNPIGCNMAFRREAVTGDAGFLEGVGRTHDRPLGCEETELSIRLRQQHPGSRIVYVPGARVRQVVPADRSTISYFRRRCFAEGISKAAVTRSVGAGDGLSSERAYLRRTLPRAVLLGLREGIRGDRAGFARAGMVVLGVVVTGFGSLRGMVER